MKEYYFLLLFTTAWNVYIFKVILQTLISWVTFLPRLAFFVGYVSSEYRHVLFNLVKGLSIGWMNWLLFTNKFAFGFCLTFLGIGVILEQRKHCFSDESLSTLQIPTILCVRPSWIPFQILMRTRWYSHESRGLWLDTSCYWSTQSLLTLRLLMAYIYIYMEHLFLMFLDHTQRRSTVGRTPLDEW